MENQFMHIAALIGDPVRSRVMWALLDGKAYTATELSIFSETTAQNISMHLGKLLQAGLLSVEKQGRHKYYRFSKPDVAYAIEALANLIPAPAAPKERVSERDVAVRYCRTCYDHLAGKVGVMIAEHMLKQRLIRQEEETYVLLPKGRTWLTGMDIPIHELEQQRRVLLRPCLDWSERRHHLAGALGAALLNRLLALGWMRRIKHSRAVQLTAAGQKGLQEHLGLDV